MALEVGQYITVRLADVPAVAAAVPPLSVFALLRHENRMSVLNLHLRMHPSWTAPIRYPSRVPASLKKILVYF